MVFQPLIISRFSVVITPYTFLGGLKTGFSIRPKMGRKSHLLALAYEYRSPNYSVSARWGSSHPNECKI